MGPGYSERMGQTKFIPTAFAIALACLIPAQTLAQTGPAYPIAYVSVQRILLEAEDAKAGAKELEALRVSQTQALNAKKQALDATKLELANSGGLFTASKRSQLAEQEKRQEADLQQATQQAQKDFGERQRLIQDRIRKELSTVVSALAIERKVVYVLNQDTALVLAPSGANWTADVLLRLNAASQKPKP
jgi:Skp family chaperone for outer membrane proteins